MLGGQDACQLVSGSLVSALEHHARALLRRREGGQNVGGGARQTDSALVDQRVILQGLVGHGDQRLAVALERAAHGQVTRGVQLLDAGDHAGGLDLDGHIAVLQHALDGQGIAVLGDLASVGHLGQVQLLGDLGANLSGIAVDGLTAGQDDVVLLHAVGVDTGGDDLGGGVGVGAAELTGGDQDALVHAHGHQLTQHAFCGRGAHGERDDLAAQLVLQGQGGFHGVQVVGVDDGLHGGTIQGAVGVHCHLTGGIGNLLHSNKNFHFTFYLLNYLTPRWLEMTMRWTSEVPS